MFMGVRVDRGYKTELTPLRCNKVIVARGNCVDMALKAFAIVIGLLCSCVALSKAQSGSGDGGIDDGYDGGLLDGVCDGAKIVYELPLTTRRSNVIFDDLQKGESCC